MTVLGAKLATPLSHQYIDQKRTIEASRHYGFQSQVTVAGCGGGGGGKGSAMGESGAAHVTSCGEQPL